MTHNQHKSPPTHNPPLGLKGVFIGIFGRQNTGKSSLINLLTGQEIAIVSDIPGTTTDPVKKVVELLGIGPVTLIDTAGVDDLSEIGKKRIKKSLDAIKLVDCAILLISGNNYGDYELQLIKQFDKFEVPYIILHNKKDKIKIAEFTKTIIRQQSNAKSILEFNAKNPKHVDKIISALSEIIPTKKVEQPSLFGGLVKPKDVVLLITPIDSEAPEGRLILPQNQAIRNLLDNDCIVITVKDTELEDFLKLGIRPALAVTDSQAFGYVAEILPEDIPLTSFSIIFARQKGDFDEYLKGTPHISKLNDGDRVLILESCTHQTSCDDIGRVKIPKLVQKFTGKTLEFTFVLGLSPLPLSRFVGTSWDFPHKGKIENETSEHSTTEENFALVIQCGGCMVTRKQLLNRLKPFVEAGIPVTNYGMTLAYVNGIFERATRFFTPKSPKGDL